LLSLRLKLEPDPKIFELKTSLGLAALVYKVILKGLGPALFHTLQMLLIVLKAFSDFFFGLDSDENQVLQIYDSVRIIIKSMVKKHAYVIKHGLARMIYDK